MGSQETKHEDQGKTGTPKSDEDQVEQRGAQVDPHARSGQRAHNDGLSAPDDQTLSGIAQQAQFEAVIPYTADKGTSLHRLQEVLDGLWSQGVDAARIDRRLGQPLPDLVSTQGRVQVQWAKQEREHGSIAAP